MVILWACEWDAPVKSIFPIPPNGKSLLILTNNGVNSRTAKFTNRPEFMNEYVTKLMSKKTCFLRFCDFFNVCGKYKVNLIKKNNLKKQAGHCKYKKIVLYVIFC